MKFKDFEERRAKNIPLSSEEINQLKEWGIKYPWSPDQAVSLIRRIMLLEQKLKEK